MVLHAPTGLGAMPPVPAGATARRLTWPHLPPRLRGEVERRLGARVIDHRSCDGGFTPAMASVLTLADGTQAFVKAASVRAQAPFAASYLVEARMLRRLLRHCPALPSPRLRWTHRDEDWVMLGFEAVAGTAPTRPWLPHQLDRALALATTIETVTRPRIADLSLRPLATEIPELATGWAGVDRSWPHRHAADELARGLRDLAADGFVHADLRDDNILLCADRALACDWNWCARGPAWFDTLCLLLTAYGDGHDADALLAAHPLTRGVPADDIDATLAALTGYLMTSRQRPVPATSPYLRAHQAWWAEAGWAWLAHRRGWS